MQLMSGLRLQLMHERISEWLETVSLLYFAAVAGCTVSDV